MKTRTLLIGAMVLVAGLTAYFLYKRRSASGPACFSPPEEYERYDSATVNWGDFAHWIGKEFGNYEENEPFIHGFLKGVDVQPKGWYVRKLKKPIREYLNRPDRLPHWEVQKGMYRCD